MSNKKMPDKEREFEDACQTFNNNKDIISAVAKLRTIIVTKKSHERLEIFSMITDGYCTHCGSDNLPCYCMKDE